MPQATATALPVDSESFSLDDAAVVFYSRAHDVSLERAAEISDWMAAVADPLSDLPTLTNTFADVRIVHGASDEAPDLPRGDVRIELRVTEPEDPELEIALAEIMSQRAGGRPVQLDLRRVPRTLAELDAIAAAEFARHEPSSVEAHYDFDAGEVTFSPAEGERPGFAWTSKCSNLAGGTMDGGRGILLSNPNLAGCFEADECTSGFPMRFAGTYGIATAGHCLDLYPKNSSGFVTNYTDRDTDLRYIYSYPTRYASTNAYWYRNPLDNNPIVDDGGYLRRVDASVGFPGRIWKYGADVWRNITAYEATFAPVGQTVCLSVSAASLSGAGEYCGEVIGPQTDHAGENALNARQWTEIDFSAGDYKDYNGPAAGGSGAPVYWSGRVYGLYSSADSCQGGLMLCNTARYYRVDSLYWDMRAITTDVHFICYPSTLCAMD